MSEEFFNHFDAIASALHDDLKIAVRNTAEQIQFDAQSLAPVDTGFLADSIYVATAESSDYGKGGFGGPDQELLPEVDIPGDDLTAIVAVGASYGEFVEMGTRYMAPQPFFYQAVDWGERELEDELSDIANKLEEKFG